MSLLTIIASCDSPSYSLVYPENEQSELRSAWPIMIVNVLLTLTLSIHFQEALILTVYVPASGEIRAKTA